ncbi:MAG: purine-nucleoside phosphorylase [Oscillospiraceae bacterium]|nr:purine-nucleoside phosphorylase [Oscillospiraceae bacterium]
MDFVNIKTPHIKVGDTPFTKTVLMPGDPKRAEFISDTFLTDVKVISDVRGIKAYRGKYNGTDVTVMASGMGMASMGIYSHELFNTFGVENIIRIGTAGAISKKAELGDLVIGLGACTDGGYVTSAVKNGNFAPIADFSLVSALFESAKKNCDGKNIFVGNVASQDRFYNENTLSWEKFGVLAVEMEAAALFLEAQMAGKKAACICTISDLVYDLSKELSIEERQTGLVRMIKTALDAAVTL